MHTTQRKRWAAVGAVFGAGVAAVVVCRARRIREGRVTPHARPSRSNTTPPTISGTPQEGSTLTGNRGQWTNNPTGLQLLLAPL